MFRTPPVTRVLVFFMTLALISTAGLSAADTTSQFHRLTSDLQVNTTSDAVVLSTTLTLTQNRGVLLVADGRFYPNGIARMPDFALEINGSKAASSQAVLDWVGSTNPVQHSFNVIAYQQLGAGTHTLRLTARNHPGRGTGKFIVGADTSMSVMVNPAPHVLVTKLGSDSGNIDLATNQPPGVVIKEGDPRPMVTLGVNRPLGIASGTPVASLMSGRAYVACTTQYQNNTPASTNSEGDAAWGIYRSSSPYTANNQLCLGNDEASWSVNDLWRGAELQSPLYGHGYHLMNPGDELRLAVGELVFNDSINNFENAVCYRAGAGTQLISLYGMQISGSAPVDSSDCKTYVWNCVGSSIGWPGCPATGNAKVLAQKTINIPTGHNGIVFFSAKTRVQGAGTDSGNVFLEIRVNGVRRGSVGVQQLKSPDGSSSRTLTASYLSADGPSSSRLSPGNHTIQVVAYAQGTFDHVSATKDLPLVYFD